MRRPEWRHCHDPRPRVRSSFAGSRPQSVNPPSTSPRHVKAVAMGAAAHREANDRVIEFRSLGEVDLGQNAGTAAALALQPKRLALLAYLCVAEPRGYQRRDKLLS